MFVGQCLSASSYQTTARCNVVFVTNYIFDDDHRYHRQQQQQSVRISPVLSSTSCITYLLDTRVSLSRSTGSRKLLFVRVYV